MRIEFHYYKDTRTKEQKLDLLNSDLMVLATLDSRDFKNMKAEGLQEGNVKDIVIYCNSYKGLAIVPNDVIPTVFDPCPLK